MLSGALHFALMSANAEPQSYRIPAVLRDLLIIDLMEITGSTTTTAKLLAMSQPSVSRRWRSVVRDLGLQRQRNGPVGQRYTNAPWIAGLRRGLNVHRLSAGFLRVGSCHSLEAQVLQLPWAQWVPLGREQQVQWRSLMDLELLDAIVLEHEPRLTTVEQQSLASFKVSVAARSRINLICRRHPLVLLIAEQENGIRCRVDRL